MKENKCLHTYALIKGFLLAFFGGLILGAPSLCLASQITQASQPSQDSPLDQAPYPIYESSIQRSRFLALKPTYQQELREQIKDRRAQLLWKFRFDFQSLQTDGNINSQIGGVNLVGDFQYKILQHLNFVSKVSLNLESGRSQSIFGDQEPTSGVYPRQAFIEYKPFKELLSLKTGLINQGFFNEGLFISRLPFIGFSEKLNFKAGRLEWGARFQQLIPTSYTLSTRVGDRENTPSFYSESLEGKLFLSRNNFIQGRLTQFRYENLPPIVAYESCLYGNTVNCTDINNARFAYGFDGTMGQLHFEQKLSDSLTAQVHWTTLVNGSAPSELGEGESRALSLVSDFGRWITAFQFKDYFIEADAVPAMYNSHSLGHNNRIGQAYQIHLESKDWGILFKGLYIRANLLNPLSVPINNLQQDNQQTFYLAMETLYDFI